MIFFFPFVLFAIVIVMVAPGIWTVNQPPPTVTAGIGRQIPAFTLPVLGEESRTFRSEELKGQGVVLVNVFASWCVGCVAEHPNIQRLAEQHGAKIYGIGWKDQPGKTIDWLKEHGNPYTVALHDGNGRVGIDLGVTGTPETLIVGNDGTVLYRISGPVTESVIQTEILPRLRGEKVQ